MAETNALPLVLLTEQFAKLPGIGMKSAQRLAYYVMSMSEAEADAFADAIVNVHKTVHLCSCCQNYTDKELCPVCSDTRRDHTTVCVVESPKDISAFERTKEYKGVYHVLHGAVNPMVGVQPENLKLKELLQRLQREDIKEVIIATNSTVEGEATALWISKYVKQAGIKVTRIASGVPVGGALEFIDEMTLFRALEGRTEL